MPYLKMRYDNTKTKGGGVGPARGFTKPGVLLFELGLLVLQRHLIERVSPPSVMAEPGFMLTATTPVRPGPDTL
ncbi:MAG TPA: hypothetical protein VHF06_15340, partial [Pseudonocardiaceae bacterium]|nr:hypothetical protein [Pseudonocardiaceae bacterium]